MRKMPQDERPRRPAEDGSAAPASDEAGLVDCLLLLDGLLCRTPVCNGGKLEKNCGSLVNCLRICAVYMEVPFKQDTDPFFVAVMRFVGGRGAPRAIYSSNGTNVVGCVSEMKDSIIRLDQGKTGDLRAWEIQLHFNRPSSSHRGSVWEHIILSVRKLLVVSTSDQVITNRVVGLCFAEVE